MLPALRTTAKFWRDENITSLYTYPKSSAKVELEKSSLLRVQKAIIAVVRSLQILVQATYAFIAHTTIVSDLHVILLFGMLPAICTGIIQLSC
jgi:hypothetical protein